MEWIARRTRTVAACDQPPISRPKTAAVADTRPLAPVTYVFWEGHVTPTPRQNTRNQR
jgi:hypothetical protein